jgi:precorrin-6B methylase 2
MISSSTKKNIIERFYIFFVKTILSNFFWEIADAWSYKNSKVAQRYDKSIEEEYRKECETCGLSMNSKILHIGCGAYPLTQIVLAQCCSGELVGIDKNLLAVKRAREVIQRHHLQNRITINHGNGIEYPVDDFDLILISSCSYPKVQILEHLFKDAKHRSTIIVREVRIATDDVLRCIREHPEIEMIQQMHHTPFPFYGPLGWDTFYLRKN